MAIDRCEAFGSYRIYLRSVRLRSSIQQLFYLYTKDRPWLIPGSKQTAIDKRKALFELMDAGMRITVYKKPVCEQKDIRKNGTSERQYPFLISFEAERSFLSANFKLISFAAYNNNLDVRIQFQFFSKF